MKYNILFFSRGRGHGHAIPDIEIGENLRLTHPDVDLKYVSYGTGAYTFKARNYNVIDLGLSDNNGYVETLFAARDVIASNRPDLIVAHEEFAAILAARLAGINSVFISAWLPAAGTIQAESLGCASRIIVLGQPGIFPIPPGIRTAPVFVGPVLRTSTWKRGDRNSARSSLGIPRDSLVLLVMGGGWATEEQSPITEIVLSAFAMLEQPNKRLIWVASKDFAEMTHKCSKWKDVTVMHFCDDIDKLIIAANLVITKGTRGATFDAVRLGVPTISISHGKNPIDDILVPRIPSNIALNARATTSEVLHYYISQTLEYEPEPLAANKLGTAAVEAASIIHSEILRCPKSPEIKGVPPELLRSNSV